MEIAIINDQIENDSVAVGYYINKEVALEELLKKGELIKVGEIELVKNIGGVLVPYFTEIYTIQIFTAIRRFYITEVEIQGGDMNNIK